MPRDVDFLNKKCHVELNIYKIELYVIYSWNLIFVKSSSKMVVFSYIIYEQCYFAKNFSHTWYLVILAGNRYNKSYDTFDGTMKTLVKKRHVPKLRRNLISLYMSTRLFGLWIFCKRRNYESY